MINTTGRRDEERVVVLVKPIYCSILKEHTQSVEVSITQPSKSKHFSGSSYSISEIIPLEVDLWNTFSWQIEGLKVFCSFYSPLKIPDSEKALILSHTPVISTNPFLLDLLLFHVCLFFLTPFDHINLCTH